jgi:hypothetical protein
MSVAQPADRGLFALTVALETHRVIGCIIARARAQIQG